MHLKIGIRLPAALLSVLLLGFLATTPAQASKPRLEPLDADGRRLYVVELDIPGVLRYDSAAAARLQQVAGHKARPSSNGGLDPRSPDAAVYRDFLDRERQGFDARASAAVGRDLKPRLRYHNIMHGGAYRLTPAEAEAMAALDGVKSITPNRRHKLETDAGPRWIGADAIWQGLPGFSATKGEGMVVGVIDTGVNWDHPSFADISPMTGYNHTNPLGSQLGLCSIPAVLCNDKLIGVYDFTDEDTNGKDNDSHGSNVASIAVGNEQTVSLNFGGAASGTFTMSGVAPRANLVSYKVCILDDPDTEEDEEGCGLAEIRQAIDQAIEDGLDVLNFSIGSGPANPWNNSYALDFLDLRATGTVVVTSNGNDGPADGTGGYPAVAPWMLAVAATTHDRFIGNSVENMTGGLNPPDDLFGKSATSGLFNRPIVWAGDYGNALCGTGQPELQNSCASNTGSTNPFAPNTFNGEIVVCERGTYGRIEKGKNVQLAGAGGMILINSQFDGESTNSDEHCQPTTHLGYQDGLVLKNWLASGSNHRGTISAAGLLYRDQFGDRVAGFSSRGPNQGVPDILKPDLMAPGVSIIGAGHETPNSYTLISGTSQASPHVAGAATLLRSLHPNWTPSQVISALVTTATDELAIQDSGQPADPNDYGAGRPQLDLAPNAGLYLNTTTQQFRNANPGTGGIPRNLNLPSLVEDHCQVSCSFTRTVTDMQGGGNWVVNTEGDLGITVTPSAFTLAAGASRTLEITVNASNPDALGKWAFGKLMFTNNTAPDAVLPVAVFAAGGDLPDSFDIATSQSSGSQNFVLNGLVDIPDGTYVAAGLVPANREVLSIAEDNDVSSVYDNPSFSDVAVRFVTVTEGALRFSAETSQSSAPDIDLFIGRDANGDGFPDEDEELCFSASFDANEYCELSNPEPGEYWVIVQNFTGSAAPQDSVLLETVMVAEGVGSTLGVTGPGIVTGGQAIDLRVFWDNLPILQGQTWYGAVTLGTDRDHPGNLGMIPVTLTRTQISNESQVLLNGRERKLVLAANTSHQRMIVDVPPDASNLSVSLSAGTAARNADLGLTLYRQPFGQISKTAPSSAVPTLPGGAAQVAQKNGVAGQATEINLSGGGLSPGRYYVVAENQSASQVALTVQANIGFNGSRADHHEGFWTVQRRTAQGENPGQGLEFNRVGDGGFLVWYTFDDDGMPVWYLGSAAISPSDNTWVADLYRYTNDGVQQQGVLAGTVSMTTLDRNTMMLGYRLFGRSGVEFYGQLVPNDCPSVGGLKLSYSGHWYPGMAGLGGATVWAADYGQAQVHYLYNSAGEPHWLLATGQAPDFSEFILTEFRGFCPTCTPVSPSQENVGILTNEFFDEESGSQHLDYVLGPPLLDSVDRMINAVKAAGLACDN